MSDPRQAWSVVVLPIMFLQVQSFSTVVLAFLAKRDVFSLELAQLVLRQKTPLFAQNIYTSLQKRLDL
jgi:hypothetical protein